MMSAPAGLLNSHLEKELADVRKRTAIGLGLMTVVSPAFTA